MPNFARIMLRNDLMLDSKAICRRTTQLFKSSDSDTESEGLCQVCHLFDLDVGPLCSPDSMGYVFQVRKQFYRPSVMGAVERDVIPLLSDRIGRPCHVINGPELSRDEDQHPKVQCTIWVEGAIRDCRMCSSVFEYLAHLRPDELYVPVGLAAFEIHRQRRGPFSVPLPGSSGLFGQKASNAGA